MFFGEFDYQIDGKNRFRVPVKLKEVLSGGAYLTKGPNGCLFIIDKKEFDRLAEKFTDCSIFDQSAMFDKRLFFSSASDATPDGQGRILLTKNLLEFAQIKKDIVFIGVDDHVELWAKEKYTEYLSESKKASKAKVKQNENV